VHEDEVAVPRAVRLVEATLGRVDALDGEAVGRLEAKVVRLLVVAGAVGAVVRCGGKLDQLPLGVTIS
jgi:hypothetical protein